MPIYHYRCARCGALEEVWAKISDPPPARCGKCGAEGEMKRQLSRSAFQLKGGGWYKDGYK
tara:strand:+ start:99 stop:281 length:183 start_codon:yes stop_codon:yes gene_type:complete